MDFQHPLHYCCEEITSDIQTKEIVSLPLDNSAVDKLETTDAQFHGSSQFVIDQISSPRSSGDFSGKQPSENTMNEYYEDKCLSNTSPRFSLPERQISFSWPSSPKRKINRKDQLSSLDHFYIHKRLSNHQNQQEQLGSKSQNKLPFLLRFHSGYFHICLGLCSQTVLWKTLQESSSSFKHFPFKVPNHFTFGLWLVALLSLLLITAVYLLKCFFYFEIVRMEYFDRVRVNYFFVPWISGMLLRLGLPSDIAPEKVHPVLCCILMVPIIVLELKIYGQWFTKGRRSLARVANPSTHLSVIGNFVLARLIAKVEWKEFAMFFFSVGLIHYLVVFITLYQRLSPDIAISRKICPVFFLFIAAPSSACVAWEAISGSFDTVSKMLLFLSLFLCFALIVRVDFFRDSMRRFSMICWACAYPMTTISVSAIKYAEELKHPLARSLAYALSSVSMVMTLILSVLTIVSIFVARDHLFPNDMIIVICREELRKLLLRSKRSRTSCFSRI